MAIELAPEVSRHMGEVYKPESVIPDDVRKTLAELKQAGYLMAVLSNRDKPFQDVLDSHSISEFFSFSLAGGEVHSYKPNPGLFEHALNRAGIAPNEAIYVGDNYFADVVGSRRAGLRPVLFDPDMIFPEADCTTIRSFNELKSTIKVL
jgi:putative hydrolase of the HAD superfamily